MRPPSGWLVSAPGRTSAILRDCTTVPLDVINDLRACKSRSDLLIKLGIMDEEGIDMLSVLCVLLCRHVGYLASNECCMPGSFQRCGCITIVEE